jgi:hypothetical protein
MSDATRQHYKLATGSGLRKGDSSAKTTPKYAKGGFVKSPPTTSVSRVAKKVPGFPKTKSGRG